MEEEKITMQEGSPPDEVSAPIDPYWLTPEGLCLLRGWTRDGFSEAAIARKLAVSLFTLQAWQQAEPKLAAALRQGREVTDYMVEEAVLRASLGFKVSEEEEKTDAKGGFSESKKTKYVPTAAALATFWLKARRPDKWGDLSAEAQDDAAAARSLENFHKALLGILPESFASLESDDAEKLADDSPESSAVAGTMVSAASSSASFTKPETDTDGAFMKAIAESSAGMDIPAASETSKE